MLASLTSILTPASEVLGPHWLLQSSKPGKRLRRHPRIHVDGFESLRIPRGFRRSRLGTAGEALEGGRLPSLLCGFLFRRNLIRRRHTPDPHGRC
jgi:hypothetical protein